MHYLDQILRDGGEPVVLVMDDSAETEVNKWGDVSRPSSGDGEVRVEVEGVVTHRDEQDNDVEEGIVSQGEVYVYIKGDDDRVREDLARFGNYIVLPERQSRRYKIISASYPPNVDRFDHVRIRGARV